MERLLNFRRATFVPQHHEGTTHVIRQAILEVDDDLELSIIAAGKNATHNAHLNLPYEIGLMVDGECVASEGWLTAEWVRDILCGIDPFEQAKQDAAVTA